MQDYVVCEKRGNFPRIHVKICQQKCKDFNTCEAFQSHAQANAPDEVVVGQASADLSPEKDMAAPAL